MKAGRSFPAVSDQIKLDCKLIDFFISKVYTILMELIAVPKNYTVLKIYLEACSIKGNECQKMFCFDLQGCLIKYICVPLYT